jgi:hypothetical protein
MDEFPEHALIFWPVGCGDSTTIVVDRDAEVVVQIDLHHVSESEDDDDPRTPIVDELVALLPERDGKPYLAGFGATHLDKDHVQGFARLLDEVTIGDLWFTPRVLWEQDQDELCEDARAFVAEAERRIKKMKARGTVESGDRIRIIGFSDALEEHSDIYKNLPEGAVTTPGTEFHSIDGEHCSEHFRAFVHAPFKADAEAERNHTSFGLQVTISNGTDTLAALLLGDLSYPTVKRIFEVSKDEDVAWDVFLSPHHCSKSVMYGRDQGETEDTLKRPLLEKIEAAAGADPYVIASSAEIPASNQPGDNPPHAEAAKRYREIVPDDNFLCTAEYPSTSAPEPIVFEPSAHGAVLQETAGEPAARASSTLAAVATARGTTQPAQTAVGFGRRV